MLSGLREREGYWITDPDGRILQLPVWCQTMKDAFKKASSVLRKAK
ncbi:MAG: hypothetical protein QXF06_05440 [Archaeoglobaceae archaeon]